MGIICTIFCLMIGIILYIKERSLISPNVAFTFLYAGITFLSSLRLYGTYPIDEEVYIIIIIGIVGFLVGCAIAKQIKVKQFSNSRIFSQNINYKMLHIFLVVGLILSLWVSIGALRLLMQGNTINDIYVLDTGNGANDVENLLGKTYFSDVISIYLVQPITYLMVPALLSIYLKTKKNMYLVFSIAFMLLRVLSHGGRAILFFTIGYIFVLLIIKKERQEKLIDKNERKTSRKFKILIILGIVFVVYMTLDRGADILRSIYFYFSGAIPHFSARLDTIKEYKYTYGLESLRGFVYPIYSTLGNIFGVFLERFEYADYIFSRLQYAVTIAPGKEMNAFVTIFCFFFIDGGYVGVIVGTILLGIILTNAYRNLIRKGDDKSVLIYCILFVEVLLYSFNCCMFSYIQVAWSVVFAQFLYKKEKIEKGRDT